MYIYYFIIFIVLVLGLRLGTGKNKRNDRIYINIAFFILILVSSIRGYEVGGDLNHYLRNFPDIGKESWGNILSERIKYGYVFSILSKIAYTIFSHNVAFLTATSVFSLCLVAHFIRRYSIKPWLSIYIYITFAFYTNTFNSVRSSMALGVGLLLFDYIINRQFIKYCIVFLIALEIHQTFILFFPLYFLYNRVVTYKYMIIAIGTSFVISQISSHLSVISLIAFAYDSGAYSDLGDTYSGGYKLFALMTCMTFAMMYINNKQIRQATYTIQDQYIGRFIPNSPQVINLFMHCMVIACCILAFSTYITLLTRMAFFFYIVVIVFWPITLQNIKTKSIRRASYFVTVVLFFAYFQFFVMTPSDKYGGSNSQGTLPYKTYWEK